MDDATSQQICLERDRLLNDAEFARSPRMCKLLRFLVDYKLSGNKVPLKAYTIATDALGRDEDFDAQTDSYPRVLMGRLRRMLENFYLRNGGENRLSLAPSKYEIILEPNGRCSKSQTMLIGRRGASGEGIGRASTSHQSRAGQRSGVRTASQRRSRRRFSNILGISILLLLLSMWSYLFLLEREDGEIDYPRVALDFPVAQPGSESAERTKAISNHLVRGLNGFGGVRIFDMRPDPSEDSPYVIRLRFLDAAADQVEDQMELRLLDRGSGEIMWSKVLPLADEGILMLELDKAVVALVGSHGEIAQIEMSKLKDDYSAGYPCLLQFDSYIRYREPQKRKPVLECLENSVGLFPNDAHLLSILAFGANMQRGFDFESKYSGMDIARQAEALDHHSAMANFVIAQSAFLAGDCVTGAAWGKKAVQLNPQDPRISGYLGLYMIGCKDLDGEKYAARALELDPNADLTVAAAVAFQMLKRRDAEAAKQLSSEYIASSPRYDPSLELTYILSSAMLDDREEARRAWKILTGRYGLTEKSPAREVLSRWIVSPFLIDEIMTVFDGVGMAEKMG